jgi:RNA polymerase sigma factor (sigma-70 family)
MPQQVLSSWVQLLRRAAARQVRDEHGDGELLARFARDGEESAFEVLVQRHGPMVWSVCRRLLARTEDVEDAFQAAFLVLLRRATSIRQGELLGNWLYGVAYRVAVRARALAARRAAREKSGLAPEPAASPDEPPGEWQPILHQELVRLPEKYRRPLVLCYLGGKTNEEAARELGWPIGTVKGRLSRARDLLRARLCRRGVSLSGAAVAATLAAARLEAALPPVLAQQALTGGAGVLSPHAVTLSKGVLHAMFMSQCARLARALVLLALVGTWAGFSLYHLAAADPDKAPAGASRGAEPKAAPPAEVPTFADRKTSVHNLMHLALAMHNYVDQYGEFPPAAACSKDGRPLLSWRVLLLPFLDQEKLFREFKLDQPWDSPHNRKLLARMPAVYAAPKVRTKEPHATFYQVFTGKGTIFEGARGTRVNDIADGTSVTILMIEAADPVPWTKPADLVYDPKKPLPRLGGIFKEGFHFARADGSVSFCKMRFREDVLRAMITRNGGEVIAGNPDD